MPTAQLNVTNDAGCICVRGARVHNLQSVDVDIPRQRLTVITGVSGSGKSSLAFDTIHAESQRRYLEGLASATRRRVAAWQRPDVDVIDGLPPTISVGQSVGFASLRSTLSTTTEVLDYLRLLFARCGQAHCPSCGKPLSACSPQEIVEQILAFETGRKVMILAPFARDRKGTHGETFGAIAKAGFVRVRVDGELLEASQPPQLVKTKPHTIEAIVDRIVVKDGLRARLRDSVELALRHGADTCVLAVQAGEGWEDHAYSSRFACADCNVSFTELEPRTFSFNSPHGACLTCRGLGVLVETEDADHDLITSRQSERQQLCPDCVGSRLNPFARRVTLAEMTLPELLSKTVSEAAEIVRSWSKFSTCSGQHPNGHVEKMSQVLERTLPAVRQRLEFLIRVGADYLTLDRPTRTLSGGEYQRARLAACLGSGLTGTCYVLDEPTVGLHPRDTAAMIAMLHDLRDQGNTVLVVEHDPDVMRHADHLIDLGPGAGSDGGRVISCGTPDEVACDPRSVTGRFLKTEVGWVSLRCPPPTDLTSSRWMSLSGVSVHNLQNVSVGIPLGALTVVSGVSGSGKTSLVHDALVPLVRRAIRSPAFRRNGASNDAMTGTEPPDGGTTNGTLLGVDQIARLVEVTQSPLGRTPASNLATYSGLWDDVCRLFTQTREARLRGFRASRFKFNAPSGRCESCRGRGVQRVRLKLLPDVFVTCPSCRGARFNAATLQVRFQGLTVADVLHLRCEQAAELFAHHPRVAAVLRTCGEVGLGYLRLGQSATTLSGGEAQRVKLATELSRDSTASTLFVLDEPTTGLHPVDVERLLSLLRRLVDAGHTVLVIEHHLDVMRHADWLIDLGPEGGSRGGCVVAEGTPWDVAQRGEGHTARVLSQSGDHAPRS